MKTAASLAVVLLSFLGTGASIGAQGKKGADENRFAILEQLTRETLRKGDWKAGNWKDPGFEKELLRTIEEVGKFTVTDATRLPLRLPVSFSNVKYVSEKDKKSSTEAKKELIFCENATLTYASDSVILADGNVRINRASRCIIFSRGATQIVHGMDNIIIAGRFIGCTGDGSDPEDMSGLDSRQSSLFLSGDCLELTHSYFTICHAPRIADVSHAHDTVFLNSRPVRDYHFNYSVVKNASFRFLGKDPRRADPWLPSPLLFKFAVKKTEPRSDTRKIARVFIRYQIKGEKASKDYIVQEGEEVGQAAGLTFPDLAGWKLTYVHENYVLFSKGHEDSGFWVDSPRPIPQPNLKTP